MSRIFSNLKSHFTNWRHWELNPVVVKELRQAVRSWAVTGTLLLFLLVLFCSAVIFFVTQSFEVTTEPADGRGHFFHVLGHPHRREPVVHPALHRRARRGGTAGIGP